MGCSVRPAVIGLNYMSKSPSPAEIIQQPRRGRGKIALNCHCLLSVEHPEPAAAAMYNCAAVRPENKLNNVLPSV